MARKPSTTSTSKQSRAAPAPRSPRPSAAAKKPAKSARAPAKPRVVSPRADYWLFKSEPDVFSWRMLVDRGAAGEAWDGVKNYQARNNMRAMLIGDLGFFYHSNEGKQIVGICQVCAAAHPDPKDTTGTWECVDVRAVCPLPRPVSLADVKANRKLADMALVTSMRLSVQPVTQAQWQEICRMAGLDPEKIRT